MDTGLDSVPDKGIEIIEPPSPVAQPMKLQRAGRGRGIPKGICVGRKGGGRGGQLLRNRPSSAGSISSGAD